MKVNREKATEKTMKEAGEFQQENYKVDESWKRKKVRYIKVSWAEAVWFSAQQEKYDANWRDAAFELDHQKTWCFKDGVNIFR